MTSIILSHGRPTFYGTGPHPLLWAGSLAGRETKTVTGIPNRLKYCVTVIVYTQFKKVAAAALYEGRTESHEQQFFVK